MGTPSDGEEIGVGSWEVAGKAGTSSPRPSPPFGMEERGMDGGTAGRGGAGRWEIGGKS